MATQIGPYPRCTLASDNACVGKEQKEQDLKKRDVCQFAIDGAICGHDLSGHRPYAYKQDGIPSSTGIASLLDGGKSMSFAWAAAAIGARHAVHPVEALDRLSIDGCHLRANEYCERCTYLRSRFNAEWTAKAELGTHVHHMALSRASGDELVDDPISAPYVDALERFYEDCRPEWEQLERAIEYSEPGHEYRGQFDGLGLLNFHEGRGRFLIDVKTGKLHFAEATLQVASYRFAHFMTTWEGKHVVDREPMPEVDGAAILWLRDDGCYRLIELPTNREAFDQFLNLRELWPWERQMKKLQKQWERADLSYLALLQS